mmetsp:Transcript_4684/g.10732  ORF Transcript_4684/g.10732 Transcript_4684/m.10732 type:complete len:360 (+) Transcript_4684:224-1303(+)
MPRGRWGLAGRGGLHDLARGVCVFAVIVAVVTAILLLARLLRVRVVVRGRLLLFGQDVDQVGRERLGVLAPELVLEEGDEVVLLLLHRGEALCVLRHIGEALHRHRLLPERRARGEGLRKHLDELELPEEGADRLVARELGEGAERDGGGPRGACPRLSLEGGLEAGLERLERLLGGPLVEVDVAPEVDDGRDGVEARDLERVVGAKESLLGADDRHQERVDDARVVERLYAGGVRGEGGDGSDGLGLDVCVLGRAEVLKGGEEVAVCDNRLGRLLAVRSAVAHGAGSLELRRLVVLLHDGREVVEHAGRLHDLRGDGLGAKGISPDGLSGLGLELAVGPREKLGAPLKHLGLAGDLVL